MKSLMKFGFFVAFAMQSVAFAQSYEGTTVSKTFKRSGKILGEQTEHDTVLASDIYKITSEYRWVEEKVWECDGDGDGDGTTGDWKGFFNVPKDRKAGALADAIRGVGLSTAKRLVEDRYFNSKPRSWSAFSSVIKRADDQYKTGFSYEVLGKYKKDNMTNLGYIVEGECRWVTKREFRRVPVKRFHHVEKREFAVVVNDAVLLSGEEESFKVVFDGFETDLRIYSKYNSFEINRFEESGRVVYELTGTRKRVDPSNNMELVAERDDRKLILTVSNPNFDPEVDEDADVYIEGEVKKDGFLFFNKPLAKFKARLNKENSTTVIDNIQASVKRGMKILVNYRIRYYNSKYYTDDQSRKETYKTKL